MPATPASAARVVVPVKAFTLAKGRLAGVLDAGVRARLARSMADHVLGAAAPLGVSVVCEDDEVAAWAVASGAEVEWTPDLGLNGAVQEAVRRLAARGVRRVVVAHADLPFARDLATFAGVDDDEVLVVADRRREGTNVLSVPTGAGFTFSYGVGSYARHAAEAARLGLRCRTVDSVHLGWDVDEPADLQIPSHLADGSALVVDGRLRPEDRP